MRRVRNILAWSLVGTVALAMNAKANKPVLRREPAANPADLSAKGWKAALLGTKEALKDKNLGMAAASLAYYATLSFFPVALGSAALYASLVSPDALRQAIDRLQGIVPEAMYKLIDSQLTPLANASQGSTIVATIISVLVLLWATSGGLQNLIKATNITYDVEESRGLVKLRLVSVFVSIGLLLLSAVAVVLLVLQGSALEQWGFPHILAVTFPYVRWLLLLLLVTFALAFVYRYAPNRKNPRWQWVSWGAVAASVIWLVATIGFFAYVQSFSNFNQTYGIFAGLVVLMTWFNVSALIVLLGAQVNKKLEDSTSLSTQA